MTTVSVDVDGTQMGMYKADVEPTQLDRIETLLGQVLARMDSTEEMVAGIVAEVKPTIDELLNSGLGRMLGIKKKTS